MNCCGDGMMASAFEAQPKAKPSSGTPPTAPCSITQVTSPWLAFLEQDARHLGRDAEAEIHGMPVLQLHAPPAARSTFSTPMLGER